MFNLEYMQMKLLLLLQKNQVHFSFLNPFCSRPATSFAWFSSPFKSLRYILWRRFKWKIITFLVIVCLLALVVLFFYSMPVSYCIDATFRSIVNWLKHKGTSISIRVHTDRNAATYKRRDLQMFQGRYKCLKHLVVPTGDINLLFVVWRVTGWSCESFSFTNFTYENFNREHLICENFSKQFWAIFVTDSSPRENKRH